MSRPSFRFRVAALLIVAVLAYVALYLWADKQAQGHSLEFREQQLADIRRCESGGDYQAVNERASEYHAKWDVTGSYGGYQFSQPMWDEAAASLYELVGRNWEGVRPDKAPPIVQDAIAEITFDRYHHALSLVWKHEGVC